MVDDDFVAAEGAERGLHRRGDGSTGVDVPEYGSIFGVIANGGGVRFAGLERECG